MGKPEKAWAAYDRFAQARKDADSEIQGRVTKARKRLEALGEKEAAE